MNDAHDMFAGALQDQLTTEQRAAFEAALEADPKLAAEFEAFADEHVGGGLENVTNWLQRSAAGVVPDAAGIHAQMANELMAKAQRRKRGKLIQLFGAITAVAAAAALVAVLILPTKSVEPQSWPDNAPGQTQVMYGGSIFYEKSVEEFHPAEGVTLHIDANSLIQPRNRGALLQRGKVVVKLEKAASYDIHVGDRTVSAEGPAEFSVTTEPRQYSEFSPIHSEKDPMFQSRLLSRFGASGFALTFSVISGAATLHGAGAPQVHNAPFTQTIQAGPPQQGQPPKPPTAKDVFDHLDGNSDGKLDSNEVPSQMMTDFDDDSSGDISFAEFQTHWKPPKPPLPLDPNDAFNVLDKNKDGVVDSNETDAQMITDMDDDSSGDIDLTEFKAHYKPAEHEFNKLDKNSDAVLDSTEVPAQMISDFDDDNSGDVDLAEFKAHWKPQPGPGPGPAGGPQGTPEDHFNHLDLNSDGKLDNTEIPAHMMTEMDDDSSGDVNLTEFKAHPPKPPKPDDVFSNLDKNSDGVLDSNETDQKMLNDFDDDNSGDVDLTEFKAHWRPMPVKPEDAFDNQDKNNDGVLDSSEIPTALVNDWDDDNSGDVDLNEFKAHHKPPQGGPGGGPGGPGGGPGGPGGGPGGPGGGPGGPKPPKK